MFFCQFWSCCLDSQRQGFNGVVTYAKTGSVLRANVAPLGDKSLDQQGRCVMTDHGKFVVFNVYVPNSGGHPMAMKMKFLTALRRAMQRERTEHGKAVILVGDYNISHKAIDIFWKDRTVHIQQVLEQAAENAADLPAWKPACNYCSSGYPVCLFVRFAMAVSGQIHSPDCGGWAD